MLRNYFRFIVYLFLVVGFSSARAGAREDFFRAVATDDASTVMTLMVRGFDPNAVDDKGQHALYLSQRDSAFKVAEALMSHPQLRIDRPNAAGETPLMMAALRGQVPWVIRLLDKGARIEGTVGAVGAVGGEGGDPRGWTPLHYAASAPDAKAVELLLARGARTDARSPNGTTPLMMAAQYGPEAAVDLLLKQGADARLRNDLGLGAADFANRAKRDSLAARLAAAR
jgi:ankyrin repeat protein